MKFTKILVSILILLVSSIFANEEEKVIVKGFRKGIEAIVDGKTVIPKIDEELPLNTTVKCDKMGYFEFSYQDETFRVEKNTTILLSDAIKANGLKNVQLGKKTDTAGVRGLKSKKEKK